MDIVKQAQIIATQKHVLDNHQLYGWLPYTHHLQNVADVLWRFEIEDDTMQAAAWLHDIIEDTRGKPNQMKARDLEEWFGADIAALVEAVTCEEGPNRKTRNALTYPKIRAAGHGAIALKLADRIANVESGGNAFSMYKKEHADFRHGIYLVECSKNDTDLDYWIGEMQDHLDTLLLGYK